MWFTKKEQKMRNVPRHANLRGQKQKIEKDIVHLLQSGKELLFQFVAKPTFSFEKAMNQ